jgi:hypothetical protein
MAVTPQTIQEWIQKLCRSDWQSELHPERANGGYGNIFSDQVSGTRVTHPDEPMVDAET